MLTRKIKFAQKTTAYYFDASIRELKTLLDPRRSVLLTDENVHSVHPGKFRGWQTIVLPAGEEHKSQSTVDGVIGQLVEMGVDRSWTLVGVGGGVVTDLTGYVASIYMRGVAFGFVPTTVLAMVDASIGGKNGVDLGVYKNMVGTIRQPGFLLYDLSFLKTLLDAEWCSGFAEIIKHAAIKDAVLFGELERSSIATYQKDRAALQALIKRNALLKTRVVQGDEFEQNERRLLNFGHTLGHALEKQYRLSHGEAVAIGMGFAARLSEELLGFRHTIRLGRVIDRYGLPVHLDYGKDEVFGVLKSDKKKEAAAMHFVLLQRIGKGVIKPIELTQLYKLL